MDLLGCGLSCGRDQLVQRAAVAVELVVAALLDRRRPSRIDQHLVELRRPVARAAAPRSRVRSAELPRAGRRGPSICSRGIERAERVVEDQDVGPLDRPGRAPASAAAPATAGRRRCRRAHRSPTAMTPRRSSSSSSSSVISSPIRCGRLRLAVGDLAEDHVLLDRDRRVVGSGSKNAIAPRSSAGRCSRNSAAPRAPCPSARA